MLRYGPYLFALALVSSSLAVAQGKPPQDNSAITVTPVSPGSAPNAAPTRPVRPSRDFDDRPRLEHKTKLRLIQLMSSEYARTRKTFPLGDKSIVINPNGEVQPGDARLYQMAMSTGTAAKVGERVKITNIAFKDKSIYLEINGGPKKKSKWYQHISVGMGNVATPDVGDERPTGAGITLEFKRRLPEMTAEELQQLLDPVLDFSVRSAEDVFLENVPPKVRDSIKNHEVLVGMTREMVVMARERPLQKMREKGEDGREYEEWIYGTPPADVIFVRFTGDAVSQVKIAKMGSPIVIKTEKEVDVTDGVVTLASAGNPPAQREAGGEAAPPAAAPRRPTLRKPDEMPEPAASPAPTPATRPDDEPEWGTGGKKQPPPDKQPPQP